VLRSEIVGKLVMKSYLSGMPNLKLGLNDKLQFDAVAETSGREPKGRAVELEDIKFHQCVRLARFENDRTITFIPPDGAFELMSYRLSTEVKPLIWVDAIIELRQTRIDYIIKARAQLKPRAVANNVKILIPVLPDVDTPHFKCSSGTSKYAPDRDILVWSLKQFKAGREAVMKGHFGLPSISKDVPRESATRRPIQVEFEVPYFTISGLQVRFLKVVEKSGYHALPWVRYITQSGDYCIRTESS
jgi:AP-1 complex subunit mu